MKVPGHRQAGFFGGLGTGLLALAEQTTQSLRSWFEGLGQSCGGGEVCAALGCGYHLPQNLGTAWGQKG